MLDISEQIYISWYISCVMEMLFENRDVIYFFVIFPTLIYRTLTLHLTIFTLLYSSCVINSPTLVHVYEFKTPALVIDKEKKWIMGYDNIFVVSYYTVVSLISGATDYAITSQKSQWFMGSLLEFVFSLDWVRIWFAHLLESELSNDVWLSKAITLLQPR